MCLCKETRDACNCILFPTYVTFAFYSNATQVHIWLHNMQRGCSYDLQHNSTFCEWRVKEVFRAVVYARISTKQQCPHFNISDEHVINKSINQWIQSPSPRDLSWIYPARCSRFSSPCHSCMRGRQTHYVYLDETPTPNPEEEANKLVSIPQDRVALQTPLKPLRQHTSCPGVRIYPVYYYTDSGIGPLGKKQSDGKETKKG